MKSDHAPAAPEAKRRGRPPKATEAPAQPPAGAKSLPFAVRHFDELPDTARVSGPVVDMLLSKSAATRWRLIKAGKLPAPRRVGGGTATFSVGEIRALLAERR